MAPITTINPDEVIDGPGLLYVATFGDVAALTAAAQLDSLPSGWREVGYTEEGSTFTWETTSEDVEVAEEETPIRSRVTKAVGTVAFAMAQASRRNAALALNIAANAANDGTLLEPPDPTDVGSVVLLWKSNDEFDSRGVLFRKCRQVGTLEIGRRKAPNKTLLPVEFRLEKPEGAEPFAFIPNANGQI